MSTRDVSQDVTDRVIRQLEAGTVPWTKPWRGRNGGRPRSMSTGKPYRGINYWLLGLEAGERGWASPWFGTYRQIAELGGQVRKGEHSAEVVFYKQLRVEDRDAKARGEKKTKTIPLLRSFRVFNAEQADGLPDRFYPESLPEPEQLPEPAGVLAAYLADGGPSLQHGGDKARYFPGADLIELPEPGQFTSPELYALTAFHEAVHSTGHPSRLNREGIAEFDHFGSGRYAREELVAQMGAAMLAADCGISPEHWEQPTASYVASWLRALKDDRKLVITAASAAERAADLVLLSSGEDEDEDVTEMAVAA